MADAFPRAGEQLNKILVIDDDDKLRQVVLKALRQNGYEPLEAADGEKGIELARQHLPALVVSDILMGGMDGYAVLRALRNETSTAAIPVILMTGAADPSSLRHGMDCGADDYLLKPFNIGVLLGAIRTRLERREALREHSKLTESRLLEVLSVTRDLVAIADADSGQLLYLNAAGRKLMGLTLRDKASELNLVDLCAEEQGGAVHRDQLSQARKHGVWVGENWLITRKGQKIPTSQQLLAHRSSNGEVSFFSVVARDVRDQKESEARLHLQSSALNAAANGIVITDRAGRIVWANKAFTQLTGYTSAEVVGNTPAMLKSGSHGPEYYRAMWRTIASGQVWRGELVNRRKDGSLYYEEMTITPVLRQDGQIGNFVAVKLDITQRKRDEDALRLREEAFRTLADNVPDSVARLDRDHRFVYGNRALERELGLPAVKFLGKRHTELQLPVHDIWDDAISAVFQTGAVRSLEFSIPDFAGKKHLESRLAPEHAADGSVEFVLAVTRDVTDERRADHDRQMMEVQLRQAHKLEAIGQLAAGIAHEINTPAQYVGDNTRFLRDSLAGFLRVIASHKELIAAAKAGSVSSELIAKAEASLVVEDIEYLTEQIPAAINESLEGVGRITRIIRAMKEFSHPGGREKTPADLNKAIETTTTVARNEWKYVANLSLVLAPELPPVPCFISEFNQCILNLVVNAAHAISDVVKEQPGARGTIEIRTALVGEMVEIRVSDTGTGIPEAIRPRIFEPFFTTKDVGRGTGQGLSMVYGTIVKKHGGTVAFETEVGKGTTFILNLPVNVRPNDVAVVSAGGDL